MNMVERETRLREIINPNAMSHSKWLWDLGNEKLLDWNTRKRLQSISCLLKYRPDIDVSENFQFEIGATYLTRDGALVKIMERNEVKGYECVRGDDNVWRYNRTTGTADIGRTTGAEGDDPRNLIPIRVRSADRKVPTGVCHHAVIKEGCARHVLGPVLIHKRDGATCLVSRTNMHVGQKFWISTDLLDFV